MIFILIIGFGAYLGAEYLFTLWVRYGNNGSWSGTETNRRLMGAALAAVAAAIIYIVVIMILKPLFFPTRRRRK